MAKENYTPNPCKKCGSIRRYKNGECAECSKRRRDEWRKNNPDKERERKNKWRKNNPEKERKRHSRWRHNNPEYTERKREYKRKWDARNRGKIRERLRIYRLHNKHKEDERKRKWHEKYPGKSSEYARNRRARLSNNGGTISDEEWQQLCDHYNNQCLACGSAEELTLDHIIPLVKGGKHDISNAQPLCNSCNAKKYTKIIDYRPDKGPKRWIQDELF